jgi:opacity protein-like surface antigen
VVEDGGFYLRGDVGVAAHDASDLRSTFSDGSTLASLGAWGGGVSVADSALVGLGLGYQFTSYVRADVTAEYRSSANYSSKNYYKYDGGGSNCPTTGSAACVDDYRALLRSGLFLANLYADLGTWAGVTPYIGGGVGFYTYRMSGIADHNWSQINAWGVGPDKTAVNFAWSLAAGLAYDIAPHLKLDLGYRYVNMGTLSTSTIVCSDPATCNGEVQSFRLASHDLRLGLRWMPMVAQAVYEPLPVRAKY